MVFFCNNVTRSVSNGDEVRYFGDQTEVALYKMGEISGLEDQYKDYFPERVSEIPFSSDRKRMSVIIKDGDRYHVYSKGAPEVILERCNRILEYGKERKLNQKDRKRILQTNENFAREALRVLGFAYKRTGKAKEKAEKIENELVWLGLQAMMDPPREEVKQALEECKTAGINVVMITGDNPVTAKAIADKTGIKSQGVLQGKDLDRISGEDLEEKLKEGYTIFARTSPFHKQKILKILQKDYIVAMTGDGVNDALAVKNADVGIAMGIKGTEITKESSDMILLDDNFATITNAIRYGRAIFNNIRKFISYLLSTNIAEVAIVFISTVFIALDKPLLLPVHILWINLLTDGLVALALGVDPAPPGIMERTPRKKDRPVISRELGMNILLLGLMITLLLMGIYFIEQHNGLKGVRTAVFTGIILFEFV